MPIVDERHPLGVGTILDDIRQSFGVSVNHAGRRSLVYRVVDHLGLSFEELQDVAVPRILLRRLGVSPFPEASLRYQLTHHLDESRAPRDTCDQ